jgi:hypothetical protein
MEKRNKIIYWVATGLLSVGMFSSGIMQIMHAKELEDISWLKNGLMRVCFLR